MSIRHHVRLVFVVMASLFGGLAADSQGGQIKATVGKATTPGVVLREQCNIQGGASSGWVTHAVCPKIGSGSGLRLCAVLASEARLTSPGFACAGSGTRPPGAGIFLEEKPPVRGAGGCANNPLTVDGWERLNAYGGNSPTHEDNPCAMSVAGTYTFRAVLETASGPVHSNHVTLTVTKPSVLPTSYTLKVTTGGTCTTPAKSASITLVYGKPAPATPKIANVDPACSLVISGTVNEPLPASGWDLFIYRAADPISPGNGVYYTICHALPGTTSCDLCPPTPGLLPANTAWQKFYTAPCGTITRPRRTPGASGASGETVIEQLSSPTGWTAIGVEIDYNCQTFSC